MTLSLLPTTEEFGFSAGFTDSEGVCPVRVPGEDAYEQLVVTRPDGSSKVLQRGVDIHVVAWEVAGFPCDLLEVPHFTGTAKACVHGQCQRPRG